MNVLVTRSGDGLIRRGFTVTDLDRMVETGVIGHEERIEVVYGDLLPMAAKGPFHETLKQHLNIHFVRALPNGFTFIQEAGWRISELLYLEPDYLFFPDHLNIRAVTGLDATLVVEISDTTLDYDLHKKAELYAGIGVQEYWVIDAALREALVHLEPERRGYRQVHRRPATDTLASTAMPGLSVRLADLPEA